MYIHIFYADLYYNAGNNVASIFDYMKIYRI